jgi:flagellar protein FlbD
MICITKLNGQKLTINCELIQTIEETPDTTITMATGDKYIAVESIDEINQKVIEYKQGLYGFTMVNSGPSPR